MVHLKQRIAEGLKNCDQHGPQFRLTLNNKDSYQTVTGGVLTILSRLGILAYFFAIISNVANREKTINISSSFKSPTADNQIYKIDLNDVDIAFGFTFQDNQPHLYEKINYFKYYDVRISYEENRFMNDTSTGIVNRIQKAYDIPLTNCTLDRFAGLSTEILNYGINQVGWYCPTNISFFLQRQVQSNNKYRLRLKVNICANTTANGNYCAPYEDIVALASKSRFQIATLNSYFDENQFDSAPIKRSLSVEPFSVAINLTQTIKRNLRKNTIVTKDSWISSQFNNQEYVFYQDIPNSINIATTSTDFLLFVYSADSEERVITRKVLSVSDAAATAGGFAGIILIMARLISGIYTRPLFYYDIVTRLNKYDSSQQQPRNETFSQQLNSSVNFSNLQDIINRKRIILVSPFRTYYQQICIMCSKGNKNIQLYQKGIQKYRDSIDVIKLIKSLTRMKTLENMLLQEYQRKLLKYSERNSISYDNRKQTKTQFDILIQNDKHIQKLIKHQNKRANQVLIQEIMGYKQKSNHDSKTSNLMVAEKKQKKFTVSSQKDDKAKTGLYNDELDEFQHRSPVRDFGDDSARDAFNIGNSELNRSKRSKRNSNSKKL